MIPSAVIITIQEILYNANLIIDLILVPISVIGCVALVKHAIHTYSDMKERKNDPSTLERKYSLYNLRTIFVRDLFLCFISVDEGIQKFLEVIDSIVLQIRGTPSVISLNLSNSCTINPVSSLGFYYHRGPGYYFLYALTNTADIMLLVLLNALTIFLIKSYSEHPRWRSLNIYLSISMVLTVITLIITPIQYTLILGNIAYSLIVLVQLIILIVQTRRLYFVLRQRKLEALSQKLAPSVIHHQETLQRSYKYFSMFILALLLIYFSGQWLDIIIVTVIGSVLENSCWFGYYFNIHYSVAYSANVFQPFKLVAIYMQFIGLLVMNGSLSLLYCAYLLYSCYQGYTLKKIASIRYTTVNSMELHTSLID
ncbi:hypothetical protein LOD99_6596 [Oopsacas minuta]|uniref:Odorant receptor n=1 Tax=Oopsacas minuta TaxID=111878 RepID=A0AAV7JM57_9METZ|nr:hypothetical protein LOD99_6596 [Oopsacas minuta]